MSEKKPTRERTERLNVRLQASMLERVEELARELGIPAATLGAVAIGEYVRTQFRQKEIMLKSAKLSSEKSALVLSNLLTDPKTIKKMAKLASAEGDDNRLISD